MINKFRNNFKRGINKRRKQFSSALMPILQCALAAGIATFISDTIIKNEYGYSYFAPGSAIISLTISLDQRLKRSIQLVLGVSVGIGVSSIIINFLGHGVWQVVIIVALAMSLAVLLNNSKLATNQAAISALLMATLSVNLKESAMMRMLDALLGGMVGVTIAALLPVNPFPRVKEKTIELMHLARSFIANSTIGLKNNDINFLKNTLESTRNTQTKINSMLEEAKAGYEITKISPLYWSSKNKMLNLINITKNVDNTLRNIRVLVRYAHSLIAENQTIEPNILQVLHNLSQSFGIVVKFIARKPNSYPDAVETTKELRNYAKKITSLNIADSAELYNIMIFGQARSIMVDLFQICGLSLISAEAILSSYD